MCTTTTHWATHISAECSLGGTGQCDGTCVDHEQECTCSCHGAFNLPDTIEAVRDWHDEEYDVLASFEGLGRSEEALWNAAVETRKVVRAWHEQNTKIVVGQGRVVIVESY